LILQQDGETIYQQQSSRDDLMRGIRKRYFYDMQVNFSFHFVINERSLTSNF